MTGLAALQASFHALVTSGPVHAGRAAALVAGSAALPPAARLGIYRDMWSFRQVEALRDDFPCLARLLGEAGFAALSHDYLAAHPSDHFDLGRLGRRLPRFLRRWGRARPERPDLSDLAALEWARAEVVVERDHVPADRQVLRALPPEALPRARLRLAFALRLLRLRHDVGPLWRALERGRRPPPPAPGPAACAVWRDRFDVFHSPLPPDEARALAAARRGEPLAAVVAHFEGRPDPARTALGALQSWLDEGWVRAHAAR